MKIETNRSAQAFICIAERDKDRLIASPIFLDPASTGSRRSPEAEEVISDNLSLGAKMVAVLEPFVAHGVSLVLGHPFESSWLDLSQTGVFHRSSSMGRSKQHCLRARCSFSRTFIL